MSLMLPHSRLPQLRLRQTHPNSSKILLHAASSITIPRRINNKLCSVSRFAIWVCGDGGGAVDSSPQQPAVSLQGQETDESGDASFGFSNGYVALFIRMLGLDHDHLDREQAIVALWKYALGGKQYIDAIMKFPGSVNLTVNLLKSDSSAACEAAAGLLRTISSVNLYRELVAESGAVEEITALLRRSALTVDVKEQSICALWNLSVYEKLRVKIVHSDLLPVLIKFLEDEDMKVKEAAGGVLANLALTHSNHNILVEAGAIPKLARLLKAETEGSKIIRKEAKTALLELAKDKYYRILILEEGLVLVPLVGAAAYKSFRPALHSWPSLPDGTEIKQSSTSPSRYGASELLIGLHVQDEDANLEVPKMNAIIGRTKQQFLARIGAIETEDEDKSSAEFSSAGKLTILPVVDGVARMVLILELDDEFAIARAAKSIADASVNEHMRISFKEAGAVKHLVRLLDHESECVRFAAIQALDKLSVSNEVCERIEAEGILYPLLRLLQNSCISAHSTEMALDILARILDPYKEMRLKVYDWPVNGSKKGWNGTKDRLSLGDGAKSDSSLLKAYEKDLSSSALLARLIEILKTTSPSLQRKASSVLEYLMGVESCEGKIISLNIESGLDAVFRQKILYDNESETDFWQPELRTLEVEAAGLAISAASRLLTRLLDSVKFCTTVNSSLFVGTLRKILASDIPLRNKDWVAACLVRLGSISGPFNLAFESPINTEVTLLETIPRLIDQMKDAYSLEVRESAVVELNRIVSEGVVDSARAVAARGGIFALVKVIEEGSERAAEAGVSVLYNLSMDDENHAAVVAAGAVPVLRRIVLAEKPQWMRALRLLRTLPT